jgi:quercetin dioxygenase-like cupin family protein
MEASAGRHFMPSGAFFCTLDSKQSEEDAEMNERLHVTEERALDAALMSFDLASVVRSLRSEESYRAGTHDAITLTKSHGLRLVVVAMKAGTELPPNRTDGSLALHVLEGEIEVAVAARCERLRAGQMAMVHAEVPYSVRAASDAAFVLTVTVSPETGKA